MLNYIRHAAFNATFVSIHEMTQWHCVLRCTRCTHMHAHALNSRCTHTRRRLMESGRTLENNKRVIVRYEHVRRALTSKSPVNRVIEQKSAANALAHHDARRWNQFVTAFVIHFHDFGTTPTTINLLIYWRSRVELLVVNRYYCELPIHNKHTN